MNEGDAVQRGGGVGAKDRRNFNAKELRQPVGFRESAEDNLEQVPARVTEFG